MKLKNKLIKAYIEQVEELEKKPGFFTRMMFFTGEERVMNQEKQSQEQKERLKRFNSKKHDQRSQVISEAIQLIQHSDKRLQKEQLYVLIENLNKKLNQYIEIQEHEDKQTEQLQAVEAPKEFLITGSKAEEGKRMNDPKQQEDLRRELQTKRTELQQFENYLAMHYPQMKPYLQLMPSQALQKDLSLQIMQNTFQVAQRKDEEMKGEQGHIQELIDFAIEMPQSKDKIEPLQKILSFIVDEQFAVLIGHMIEYFKQNSQFEERIYKFRNHFMRITGIGFKNSHNKCPLIQILHEVHIITSQKNQVARQQEYLVMEQLIDFIQMINQNNRNAEQKSIPNELIENDQIPVQPVLKEHPVTIQVRQDQLEHVFRQEYQLKNLSQFSMKSEKAYVLKQFNKIIEVYIIISPQEQAGLKIQQIFIKLENKGASKSSEYQQKQWIADFFLIPGLYVYKIQLKIYTDQNLKEVVLVETDSMGKKFKIQISSSQKDSKQGKYAPYNK